MSTREMERQIDENVDKILAICDEMRRKGLLPPKEEKVSGECLLKVEKAITTLLVEAGSPKEEKEEEEDD